MPNLPSSELPEPPYSAAESEDTGGRLRALYDGQGGVGAIFSAKVADYVASRPDYPSALFDTLGRLDGLRRGSTVVDVGAGTGLLSRGLLDRGFEVIAVDPNPAMLQAADAALHGYAGYRGIAGAAESTSLAAACADLVTAAQAFHWFDIERARNEFLRILRPTGQVALIWNDRLLSDPLHIALDDVFADYGGAKRGALVAHEERHDVPRFFGAGAFTEHAWPHAHWLDEPGLLSLVFSRSYMPDRHSAAGRAASDRVRAIFRHLADGAMLAVRYTTVAIIGRPG